MIQYRIWTEKYAELFQTKLDDHINDLSDKYGKWQRSDQEAIKCFKYTVVKKEREEALKSIANIVGDVIQEQIIKQFAKKYLKTYKGLKKTEKKEIEALFIHNNYMAKEEGVSYISYYVIYTPLMKELEKYKAVNIDGWINFRTQKYKTILEDVLEQTIYDYEMQKDYIQFINFLIDTKSMQESKELVIHLIPNKNGEISLLNEQKEDQTQKFIRLYCEELEEENLKIEDKVLHILINIAPQKVIIHKNIQDFNPQFLETIKVLFKEQIAYCSGCKVCK